MEKIGHGPHNSQCQHNWKKLKHTCADLRTNQTPFCVQRQLINASDLYSHQSNAGKNK